MKTKFKQSFAEDLSKISDPTLRIRLQQVIEAVEQNGKLPAMDKLVTAKSSENFYALKLGEYWVGLNVVAEQVIFVRILHNKEITQYFLE